jgi:hypothetical protein
MRILVNLVEGPAASFAGRRWRPRNSPRKASNHATRLAALGEPGALRDLLERITEIFLDRQRVDPPFVFKSDDGARLLLDGSKSSSAALRVRGSWTWRQPPSAGDQLAQSRDGNRPGRPGWSPTQTPADPDVPVKEASGSSPHDFATRQAKLWTTRARGRLYRSSRRANLDHVMVLPRLRRDSRRLQVARDSSRNSWRLKKLPIIP